MGKKGLRLAVLLTFIFCSGGSWAARFLVPFDLAGGPLSESLIQFAKQADVTLSVSNRAIAHLRVDGLKGVMTLRQALDQLLAGTGLGYRFIDTETVSISASFGPKTVEHVADRPPPPGLQPKTEPFTIEEVTVTAQRTSENLQKVPVAVSVLNQFTLSESGVGNLTDINNRIPGLTVSSYSLGQPTIHMRGIGSNDDGAAMDNSVVAFVDDVYVGRITHIDLNLLDLERVEVLRGPQGTLYGKNAIGGAIKLVSKLPTGLPAARVSLGAGNLDHREVAALINGPLAQDWLGRVHFKTEAREGWQRNLVTGEQQHDNNRWALRGKLLHRPRENLELHWSLDGSLENLNSSGRIPVASQVPVRVLDAQGKPLQTQDENGDLQFETRLPTELFGDLGGDARHAVNSIAGYTDRKIWGATQRLVYHNEAGTLTSISGYRSSHFRWAEDSTGLPVTITDQTVGSAVDETHRQFSQELRWASPSEQPLSYVLGLYYLRENTRREEIFPFQKATPGIDQDNRSHSFAAYAQLNYQWSDKLQLRAGARYTYDHKTLRQQATSDDAPAVILEDFSVKNRDSWNDLSPFVSLAYHYDDDLMLYSSIARGMKSGGFQGAPSTLQFATRSIDPEFAWDLELGLKSQWLADMMRINVAAFYTDYRDLQVVQFRTIDNFGVFETDNAASATLRGVEVELLTSPLPGLTLTASYAFLRATYDSFNDFEGRDFTGNSLRQAPKHSAVLGVHYEFPWWRGRLHLRADYRYQSDSFREPDNEGAVQPAFRLFDGSLTYFADNNRWQMSLWSKNLADETYISHLFRLGGNDYALYGTPRTYGLNVTWNWL